MNAQVLYALAEQDNIEIIQFPMKENGSISFATNTGKCYIGIDKVITESYIQERVHLAHELGHCITGSFYNRYSDFDCRQRHENRADKWAIRQLITEDALDQAVAEGHTEVWDLAEHFGVTEQFIKKAISLYVHGNVAEELYF